MQQRIWKQQCLGVLAGLAALSLSATSLHAQDTSSTGTARMDTSQTDSAIAYDSTMHNDSTNLGSDTTKQNPPGYRGMETDTSTASGDTSAAGDTSTARDAGQTTRSTNDSTWRDSVGLNRDKGDTSATRPSRGAQVTEVGGDTSSAGTDTSVRTPKRPIRPTADDSTGTDTSKMGP